MNKIERGLLYTVSLAVIIMAVYGLHTTTKSNKLVYVDISKLLDKYKFRNELQDAARFNINKIQLVIDSLKMVKKFNPAPAIDSQLSHANYAMEQYVTLSNKEATQKIWDRLNPAIEAYGKLKGLDMIIGANGTGTVLYGSKQKDITEDLAQYINTIYEKGN